jgi:hypothetical protein
MSQLVAHQWCRLLASYQVGGITFLSIIANDRIPTNLIQTLEKCRRIDGHDGSNWCLSKKPRICKKEEKGERNGISFVIKLFGFL